MQCPQCSAENAEKNEKCVQCGTELPRQQKGSDFDLSDTAPSADAPPPQPPPYSPPPPQPPYSMPTAQAPYPMPSGQAVYGAYPSPAENLVDTLIPTKNPNALISYYL